VRSPSTAIRVSLEYLAAWVGGAGAVAIDYLMEDAATVEISRMQVWQWIRHGAVTAGGTTVTDELARTLLAEEASRLSEGADERTTGLVAAAVEVFEATCLTPDWPQFFTGYAYDHYLAAH
jgi:malate synthase